jgi:hypothetical protein
LPTRGTIYPDYQKFDRQQNVEMQAWYAKTFAAKLLPPDPGAAFVHDQLPSVFIKKLDADGIMLDRPYVKVAHSASRSRSSRIHGARTLN